MVRIVSITIQSVINDKKPATLTKVRYVAYYSDNNQDGRLGSDVSFKISWSNDFDWIT